MTRKAARPKRATLSHEAAVLIERRRRAGLPTTSDYDSRVVRVVDPVPPEKKSCPTCLAEPGEHCVSMDSGMAVPFHAKRVGGLVTRPRFVGDSNKLSEEGMAFEVEGLLMADVSRLDRFRYDPPVDRVIPLVGAYVTFVGSPHAVSGAFQKLKPGHTYFATHAPDTRDGYDHHGQFKVYFETGHGPVTLFAYEYVVLTPLHLWHLVREGALAFLPKNIENKEFGVRFHYCLSRGIDRAEALLMCLGDIHQNVGHFAPTDERGAQWWRFQGVGLTPMVKEEVAVKMEAAARRASA